MRFTALLVSIAMLLSISVTLVSCGGDSTGDGEGEGTGDVGGNEGENENQGTGENDGNTEGEGGESEEPEEPSDYETVPVTVVENYLPADLAEEIYTVLESPQNTIFKPANLVMGPFAYADVFGVSNGTLKSITIPVRSTEAPNSDGKFVITIVKVKNTTAGIAGAALETYTVTVDPYEHGLLASKQTKVYKKIVVDLTPYNIVLGENETVAVGKSGDSIIPAMLEHKDNMDKAPLSSISETFPDALGAFRMVGMSSGAFNSNEFTICFDFEIERTYESQAAIDRLAAEETAYQAAVEALKEIYRGKNVSVVGDSISTFKGITSNSSFNQSLSVNSAKNEHYPSADPTTSDYTKTYWGKVIKDLEMTLCVNNSMSGAFVTGSEKRPSFPNIATQLHQDNGTPNDRSDDVNPDVVLVFFGINDVDNNRNVGKLIQSLNTVNGKTDEEKVRAWFEGVLSTLQTSGGTPSNIYTNFDEAYALGLARMMEEYEGVEVYCFTLVRNYTEGLTQNMINNYNRVITAIANYFGATVVDQNGELSEFNFTNSFAHSSLNENKAIHPRSSGHARIGKLAIKTIAKKNGLAYND